LTGLMEHEHTAEAIRERLESGPQLSYLRDWIYGGIDGAVTTFAIVAGVVGGQLSPNVVVILGVANLIADGFSMAASNFSGTKAERDEHDRLRDIEYRHIRLEPAGEREEVRQIYQAKGFEGADLDRIVEVITSDRERWVETMLVEEYGLPKEIRSPSRAALSTFAAFVICGVVPLIPYLFGVPSSFAIATICTLAVFFVIGSAKSLWSVIPWWRSGLETLAIGATAAALAYGIGAALRGMVT
jgi:vacuolar iron transporter family protein